MPEDPESHGEREPFTPGDKNNNPNMARSKSYMTLKENFDLYKVGLIFLVIIVLSLTAISVCMFLVRPRSSMFDEDETTEISSDGEITCTTDVCKQTAKYFYDNMDLSIDPCEDFYNFSCGSWGKHNPRPEDEYQWGVNSLVQTRLNKQIASFLDNKDDTTKLADGLQKARNFFESCLNTEFRNERAGDEVQKYITKLGGFPMQDKNWNQANFDWQTSFIYSDIHINAAKLFFSFSVDRQTEADIERNIKLEVPESFYSGDYLEDPTAQELNTSQMSFREDIKESLRALNSTLSDRELDRDIDDFISFEKQLGDLLKESKADDDDLMVYTIEEMQGEFRDVNWLKLFQDIFKVVNITITKDEKIYTENPTYFKKIGSLLRRTSKRTLANYIAFTVFTEFGKQTMYTYDDPETKKVDMEQLKKDCTTSTERFFKVAVNYWYTKTFLGRDAMDDLKGFLKEIKAALTLTINTNEWMEAKTKMQAQLKLNRMIHYIASPSEIKNDDMLNEYYQKTREISKENYVKNFKRMSKWIKYDQLHSLRDTVDNEVPTPSEVNAFYSPYDNKIEILIGFLSPPNFYPNAPLAINVPAIGSTIGHEVTHGFDNSGSQYDSKGYKNNWWDKATASQYKTRVDCFIKQYSEFREPKSGLKVNGKKTVGENIADNGAVQQTYTAYKLYAALKHPEKDMKLPGDMNQFTKEQLFFIAYANTYCNDHHPRLAYMLRTDEHPPDVARVIIPLQNSEQFAKAFKCKTGSTMNPIKKCLLW